MENSILNKEQLEAVNSTEGYVLILAGAGTGKTHTIEYRVAHLIDMGISPEAILLLTFTKRAAKEMKDRAAKILGSNCDIDARTYHSFCYRELCRYQKELGINDFTMVMPSQDRTIIKAVREELKMTELDFKNESVQSLFSSAVNHNMSINNVLIDYEEEYEDLVPYSRELTELYYGVNRYKTLHQLMNYDDILIRFDAALKQHPEVALKIEKRYSHIMIDEYQDSNRLQDSIIFQIRKYNHNLCVVGDDQQSIYGFRGSDVSNIISFPERAKPCKIIKLVQNYRSNQEILDVANVVSENALQGFKKHLVGTHNSYIKPKVVWVDDKKAQVKAILSIISELKYQKKYEYKDICILQRGSNQSLLIEAYFESMKIPYEKRGGSKFLDRKHIQDVFAMMSILKKPYEFVYWLQILDFLPSVGVKTAEQFAKECSKYGVIGLQSPNCKATKNAHYNIERLYNNIEYMKEQQFPQSFYTAVNFYLTLLKEAINTAKSEKSQDEAIRKYENVKKDLKIVSTLAAQYDSLSTFWEEVIFDQDTTEDENEDKLVISTIHSAKGLEFKAVIILNCVDGIFPKDVSSEKKDEEERRCFYVAVTRAKEYLYMANIKGYTNKDFEYIDYRISHYLQDARQLLNETEY